MQPIAGTMSPPESAYGLWFYPEINRFVDEDGTVLQDLHDLFDVWELEEWKKTQNYDVRRDRKGDWCELYYLSSAIEELDFYERNDIYIVERTSNTFRY